jgi:hypothetical protein
MNSSIPPNSDRITGLPSAEETSAIQQFEGDIKNEGEFKARLDNIARQRASTVKMPSVNRRHHIVMGVRVPAELPKVTFK